MITTIENVYVVSFLAQVVIQNSIIIAFVGIPKKPSHPHETRKVVRRGAGIRNG